MNVKGTIEFAARLTLALPWMIMFLVWGMIVSIWESGNTHKEKDTGNAGKKEG